MSIWILQPDADGNCCDCAGRTEPCDSCTNECFPPNSEFSPYTIYDCLAGVVGFSPPDFFGASLVGPKLVCNGSDDPGSEGANIEFFNAIEILAGSHIKVNGTVSSNIFNSNTRFSTSLRIYDETNNLVSSTFQNQDPGIAPSFSPSYSIVIPQAGIYQILFSAGTAAGQPDHPTVTIDFDVSSDQSYSIWCLSPSLLLFCPTCDDCNPSP